MLSRPRSVKTSKIGRRATRLEVTDAGAFADGDAGAFADGDPRSRVRTGTSTTVLLARRLEAVPEAIALRRSGPPASA